MSKPKDEALSQKPPSDQQVMELAERVAQGDTEAEDSYFEVIERRARNLVIREANRSAR